jgi:hypothetical protein
MADRPSLRVVCEPAGPPTYLRARHARADAYSIGWMPQAEQPGSRFDAAQAAGLAGRLVPPLPITEACVFYLFASVPAPRNGLFTVFFPRVEGTATLPPGQIVARLDCQSCNPLFVRQHSPPHVRRGRVPDLAAYPCAGACGGFPAKVRRVGEGRVLPVLARVTSSARDHAAAVASKPGWSSAPSPCGHDRRRRALPGCG